MDDTQTLYESRIAVCNKCPDLSSILGVAKCGHCGCVLQFKARIPQSKCPNNSWTV